MKDEKVEREKVRLEKLMLQGYSIIIYLFLFAPIAVVVYMSFNSAMTNRFPIQEYSLKWYGKLIHDSAIWESLKVSLIVAFVAVFIVLIIGTFGAYAIVRYQFRLKSAFICLMLAPMLMPAVITGVSMLMYFSFLGIKTSIVTIILGHSVLTLPYAAMIITARLQGFNRSLEEVARNLGANEAAVFFKIVLPQIKPGLLSAALFAFTISMDEFALTYFVNSPESQTLPVHIYSMLKFGLTPELNALSTVILGASFLLIAIRAAAKE